MSGFLSYVTENPTSQIGLKTKESTFSLDDVSRIQLLSFSISSSDSNQVRSPGYMEVTLRESEQGMRLGGGSGEA